MTDGVWFWLRLLDYLLYGGILTGIIMRSRHLIVPGWPLFRWGLWGLVAALAYATGEAMFLGVPGGPRQIVITVPLLVLFAGCYLVPAWRWVSAQRHKHHTA